jgi:hypothetical protein
VPECGGKSFEAASLFVEDVALRMGKAVDQVIQSLFAPMDQIHHAGERAVLRQFGQVLAEHQQVIAHRFFQTMLRPGELLLYFLS